MLTLSMCNKTGVYCPSTLIHLQNVQTFRHWCWSALGCVCIALSALPPAQLTISQTTSQPKSEYYEHIKSANLPPICNCKVSYFVQIQFAHVALATRCCPCFVVCWTLLVVRVDIIASPQEKGQVNWRIMLLLFRRCHQTLWPNMAYTAVQTLTFLWNPGFVNV